MRSLPIRSLCLCALVASAGCGSLPSLDKVIPDKRTEYRKSRELPELEVPPDLSVDAITDRTKIPEAPDAAPETTTFSQLQQQATQQRAVQEQAVTQVAVSQLVAGEQVIVVPGAPTQIWPRLRQFWSTRGYALELDDPDLGVMETGWLENDADLERDGFKLFVDQGKTAGSSVIYLSHVGQELFPQGEQLVWRERQRDLVMQAEVGNALGVTLGAGGAVATTPGYTSPPPGQVGYGQPGGQPDYTSPPPGQAGYGQPAGQPDYTSPPPGYAQTAPVQQAVPTAVATGVELISAGGGKIYLTLQQDFDVAWRNTEIALTRVGARITEADRQRGLYLVSLSSATQDRTGRWKSLAFWKRGGSSDELRLSLTGVGRKTEMVVLDDDGRWDTSEEAGELLTQLRDQLVRI